MPCCPRCHTETTPGCNFCNRCGQRIYIFPEESEPADPQECFPTRNGGRVAASVTLLGFVLPWVNCAPLSDASTGLGLAIRPGGACLWTVPVSVISALVLLMARRPGVQRIQLGAASMLIAGVANVFSIAYYYFNPAAGLPGWTGPAVADLLRSGASVCVFGSLVLAAAGWWQLKSASRDAVPAFKPW